MKTRVLLLLLAVSLCGARAATPGPAFTYQGRLNDAVGLAGGEFDMSFVLHDAPVGGNTASLLVTNENVWVTNGLFTTTVDFGTNAFTGKPVWLEIAVRPGASNGAFETLAPRQPVTSVPFAQVAATLAGQLGAEWFKGAYGEAVSISNAANIFAGTFRGNGGALTNLNAAALVGQLPAASLSNAWRVSGNAGTTPSNHFLGTTDNQPLELRVNSARALRLQPDASPANAPNLLGGSPVNTIAPGIAGATIAGGGSANYEGNGPAPNTVALSYGTVGGGVGNDVSGAGGVIAGGYNNTSRGFFATVAGGGVNTANGDYASVGGGLFNQATNPAATVAGGQNNLALGSHSSVGGGSNVQALGSFARASGGRDNLAQVSFSFVGGGLSNTASSSYATVGGGQRNQASGSSSAVAGGIGNLSSGGAAFVGGGNGNIASGVWAVIGGGLDNVADENYAVIGGGQRNNATGLHAMIGGGDDNTASGQLSSVGGGDRNLASGRFATVGGGSVNDATNAAATVAGGIGNEAFGPFTAVGGGSNNTASGISSTIGGGQANTASANYSTVAGGWGNWADDVGSAVLGGRSQFASGAYSVIAGGSNNTATGDFSFVGGGLNNIATNRHSIVVGGNQNRADGPGAFVGNGYWNASRGSNSVVVGGSYNAATHEGTVVGGGAFNEATANYSTVAGGIYNLGTEQYATVGGGLANQATAYGATIPGGHANQASGLRSFAAGYQAHANDHGAFVWADNQGGIFGSTAQNQFLIRAGGGVGIGHNNPDAPLHVRGGVDVTLNSGGTLILGPTDGANLALDSNEIMARNNGNPATLFLNAVNGGDVSIGTTSGGARLRVVNATCDGFTWYAASDRNLKAGFKPVDARAVLEQVAALPLTRWHYTNAPGVQHVGPMAQDFHATFGLGADDKSIGNVDADGVALAAIQGLHALVKEQAAELKALRQELSELRRTANESKP